MKNHSKNRLKNSCRSCKIVSMSGGLEFLATTLSILMVYIVIHVSLSKRLLKKDQQHGHELHSGVQFTALLNYSD